MKSVKENTYYFIFKAFQFHCPVGLHYDSSIKACNWPEAVSCGAAASMYKQGICGGLNDGLYSDPHARDKVNK